MSLVNRQVLLLCPTFFGYEVAIQKTLEELGATVYAFDERPKNDFLTKALIRLNQSKLIAGKIRRYYATILAQIASKPIDTILLINPEAIDTAELGRIKETYPKAKVVIYLWDALENKPNAKLLRPLADAFFSFDLRDAEQYDDLQFLPLFYIQDYAEIAAKKVDKIYDISFVGTIHSDRYQIVKEVEQFAKRNGKNVFSYFYCPSPLVFFYRKYITKELKDVDKTAVSYRALSREQVVDIIAKSHAVIDVEHPKQHGLTMRTLEMLGAKRKLITTNLAIKNYDFYNENNVFVLDRNNFQFGSLFLERPYVNIKDQVYKKYALSSWLRTLMTVSSDKEIKNG